MMVNEMTINILVGGPREELPENFWKNSFSEDHWIGADKGAVDLVKHHQSLLFAVGDFDSSSEEEIELVKENVPELITFKPEKDYTDTELSVKLAIDKYHPKKITIYGATGGRIDHLLANIMFVLKPEFRFYADKIKIIDRRNIINFFLPGKYTINKEESFDYLAFIPLEEIKDLNLYDEKYKLNNANYAYPIALASNEFVGDKASFSFKSGLLCVIQSKD